MISLPYVNSNWSYSPETAKLGVDLCDLELWPLTLTLTFCMDITSDDGNNSWKFHDDTMMGTWWKRCDGQTDGRTDRRTDWTSHIAAWSQLKKHYENVFPSKCNTWLFIPDVIYQLHILHSIGITLNGPVALEVTGQHLRSSTTPAEIRTQVNAAT